MERRSPGGVGTLITTAHWTKTAGLLLGVVVACAAFLTLGAAPVSADDDPDFDARTGDRLDVRRALIFDQFSLEAGQPRDMDGRAPDTASIGTLWAVELGDWYILGRKGGSVVERSPEEWYVATDKRANIDAERANVLVRSRIKRRGGYQYFGVTARHSGPVDWLGAWFDPEGWPSDPASGEECPGHAARCGAIVLGAKDQDQAPEQFIELERARFDWNQGKTHVVSLAVVGDQVTVRVGTRVMIRAEFSGLGDATEVGLFSRGKGSTEFQNFLVTGRLRLARLTEEAAEHSSSSDGGPASGNGRGQDVRNVVARFGSNDGGPASGNGLGQVVRNVVARFRQ